MSNSRYILFVAYLFEPDKTVGSKRMTFWAKNWKSIHPKDTVIVITNTSFEIKSLGIDLQYFIPSIPSNSMLTKGIKDEGINWSKPVINFIINNDIRADISIISGSPFMHFGIQNQLKKRGSKTILDYRDPFANNPRFENNFIKVIIKRYFEKKFNKNANAVLTVNDYCLQLLAGYSKRNLKYKVIKNGYDNSINKTSEIILQNKLDINFIYGGTFFEDRSALPLMEVLDKNKHKLHHIGTINNFSKILLKYSNYKSYGLRSYDQLLKGLSEADVCVLFSSGKAFESTTKVYDYISENKTIWIISNVIVSSGALYEELKDYPKVIFSQNKISNLIQDLPKIKNLISANINFNSMEFSRKTGLEKLSTFIDNI